MTMANTAAATSNPKALAVTPTRTGPTTRPVSFSTEIPERNEAVPSSGARSLPIVNNEPELMPLPTPIRTPATIAMVAVSAVASTPRPIASNP